MYASFLIVLMVTLKYRFLRYIIMAATTCDIKFSYFTSIYRNNIMNAKL